MRLTRPLYSSILFATLLLVGTSIPATAGDRMLSGTALDDAGGVLPGVVVELTSSDGSARRTETDAHGVYLFAGVAAGRASLSFTLVNFAIARRDVVLPASGDARVNVVLSLALNADVTVTGKSTFTNLADAEDPARDLVGVAQSASQGAITARQLDGRPVMRTGEVLETVPGVVISQHSGEGKANQYYLRGFNLDHGTDFATTVAGMPVNMPTHGHGHGYSDLNFLIPELVSGVQFSKGPYFAEQGDFATAGAANINYANALAAPIVRATGGGQGFARAILAASPRIESGHLLGAVEVQHNDGPWERPDNYEKVNALVRFSHGDSLNGFAVTAMGYRGTWDATDQVPSRALAAGNLGRFSGIDATTGGNSYRYSGSLEWQRTRGNASTKLTAFGIGYDLDLFSNFTYFLDDPENGDQFQQSDHRFVSGARLSHRRIGRIAGHATQNTIGVQLRNDDIGNVGLYHTRAREVLETVREDSVLQTSAAAFAQNETAWTPWLRTLAGMRVDGYRFRVNDASANDTGLVSPKAGAILGPWAGTELYVNAGFGFHSNDARSSARPLARARGAEVGIRSVRIPRLHTSFALWTLGLDSELLFVGDAGTTEEGRASRRYGFEWANYYSPTSWLIVDADLMMSNARFTDDDPAGRYVPGAVNTVVSAGATVNSVRNVFGTIRWRYFGPRPLVEDNSVRSRSTSLVNVEAGYKLAKGVRVAVDVFNLFGAKHSDIDYFYTSRLPGEPAEGVDDIHLHPTLPRTARITVGFGF